MAGKGRIALSVVSTARLGSSDEYLGIRRWGIGKKERKWSPVLLHLPRPFMHLCADPCHLPIGGDQDTHYTWRALGKHTMDTREEGMGGGNKEEEKRVTKRKHGEQGKAKGPSGPPPRASRVTVALLLECLISEYPAIICMYILVRCGNSGDDTQEMAYVGGGGANRLARTFDWGGGHGGMKGWWVGGFGSTAAESWRRRGFTGSERNPNCSLTRIVGYICLFIDSFILFFVFSLKAFG